MKQEKKSKYNCVQMTMMAHVEQNIGSKWTLFICVEDPCEKSSVVLSLTEVENKAIGDNLESIMGIMKVHNKMNLVHAELRVV